MKLFLEKELELSKKKQSNQDSANKGLKDVQLLLEGEGAKDAHILRELGVNSTFVKAETAFGKKLELERLDNEYGKVYTVAQIRDLAIKYKLRFLNSGLYEGDLDVQLISKIKQFSKDTGVELNDATLRWRFSILAPVEVFNVEEAKKDRNKWIKDIANALSDPDPILFYRIDDGHYRFIHKWGSDFTILRRLKGWKYESQNKKRLFNTIVQLPFIALLLCLCFGAHNVCERYIVSTVFVCVASLVIAVFRNWNSITEKGPFTCDHGMLSPTNWNSSVLTT